MNPLSIGQLLAGYAQAPAPPPPSTAPLPSWLPQNVQTYMRNTPSYGEGDVQAPQQYATMDRVDAQDTPAGSPLNPQPGDVRDLFLNQIIQRAPPNPIPPGPGIADAIRRGLFNKGDNI